MRYLPLKPWLALTLSVILGLFTVWLLIDLATFVIWFSLLLLFTSVYFLLIQVVLPKFFGKRRKGTVKSQHQDLTKVRQPK